MITLPTRAADELCKTESEHSLTFAVAFGVLAVIATIATAFFGWVLALPYAGYLTVLIFLAGGIAVGVILLTGLRRGRWFLTRVIGIAEDWIDAEIKAKELPTSTYLPTETPQPREIPVTNGNRAGVVTLDYVNGFDPRDLTYFATYLARGNPTSEARLEQMPLPYEGGAFGGATPGTPFTRILDLCEQKNILSPRDGQRRKSGKLLITDEKEILRLLLQEDK